MGPRDRLGYWFFCLVLVASIPFAVSMSLDAWRHGLGIAKILSPIMMSLSLLHLARAAKHHIDAMERRSQENASDGLGTRRVP